MGLNWAYVMLALIIVESLVLGEIFLVDLEGVSLEPGGVTGIYFLLVIISAVLQLAGILFVKSGKFRLGGVLQIIASSLHVIKIEGLIGIIGGLDAYNYLSRKAEQDSSAQTQ